MNELVCNNPVDFITKPVAIANGSIRKKLKEATIHLDEMLPNSRREKFIVGSFVI